MYRRPFFAIFDTLRSPSLASPLLLRNILALYGYRTNIVLLDHDVVYYAHADFSTLAELV